MSVVVDGGTKECCLACRRAVINNVGPGLAHTPVIGILLLWRGREDVNVVRTWGALRVMSPDGYPIYEESTDCPGAFVVTCHSGITLAPVHSGPLVEWMRSGAKPEEIRDFKAERFNVQTH